LKAILKLSLIISLILGCEAKNPTGSATYRRESPNDGRLGKSSQLPSRYRLANFPNPFNLRTNIIYRLPESSHVKLIIYDCTGRKVRALIDRFQMSGYYQIAWDAKDDMGKPVASGIYFYTLEVDNLIITEKMVLAR